MVHYCIIARQRRNSNAELKKGTYQVLFSRDRYQCHEITESSSDVQLLYSFIPPNFQSYEVSSDLPVSMK